MESHFSTQSNFVLPAQNRDRPLSSKPVIVTSSIAPYGAINNGIIRRYNHFSLNDKDDQHDHDGSNQVINKHTFVDKQSYRGLKCDICGSKISRDNKFTFSHSFDECVLCKIKCHRECTPKIFTNSCSVGFMITGTIPTESPRKADKNPHLNINLNRPHMQYSQSISKISIVAQQNYSAPQNQNVVPIDGFIHENAGNNSIGGQVLTLPRYPSLLNILASIPSTQIPSSTLIHNPYLTNSSHQPPGATHLLSTPNNLSSIPSSEPIIQHQAVVPNASPSIKEQIVISNVPLQNTDALDINSVNIANQPATTPSLIIPCSNFVSKDTNMKSLLSNQSATHSYTPVNNNAANINNSAIAQQIPDIFPFISDRVSLHPSMMSQIAETSMNHPIINNMTTNTINNNVSLAAKSHRNSPQVIPNSNHVDIISNFALNIPRSRSSTSANSLYPSLPYDPVAAAPTINHSSAIEDTSVNVFPPLVPIIPGHTNSIQSKDFFDLNQFESDSKLTGVTKMKNYIDDNTEIHQTKNVIDDIENQNSSSQQYAIELKNKDDINSQSVLPLPLTSTTDFPETTSLQNPHNVRKSFTPSLDHFARSHSPTIFRLQPVALPPTRPPSPSASYTDIQTSLSVRLQSILSHIRSSFFENGSTSSTSNEKSSKSVLGFVDGVSLTKTPLFHFYDNDWDCEAVEHEAIRRLGPWQMDVDEHLWIMHQNLYYCSEEGEGGKKRIRRRGFFQAVHTTGTQHLPACLFCHSSISLYENSKIDTQESNQHNNIMSDEEEESSDEIPPEKIFSCGKCGAFAHEGCVRRARNLLGRSTLTKEVQDASHLIDLLDSERRHPRSKFDSNLLNRQLKAFSVNSANFLNSNSAERLNQLVALQERISFHLRSKCAHSLHGTSIVLIVEGGFSSSTCNRLAIRLKGMLGSKSVFRLEMLSSLNPKIALETLLSILKHNSNIIVFGCGMIHEFICLCLKEGLLKDNILRSVTLLPSDVCSNGADLSCRLLYDSNLQFPAFNINSAERHQTIDTLNSMPFEQNKLMENNLCSRFNPDTLSGIPQLSSPKAETVFNDQINHPYLSNDKFDSRNNKVNGMLDHQVNSHAGYNIKNKMKKTHLKKYYVDSNVSLSRSNNNTCSANIRHSHSRSFFKSSNVFRRNSQLYLHDAMMDAGSSTSPTLSIGNTQHSMKHNKTKRSDSIHGFNTTGDTNYISSSSDDNIMTSNEISIRFFMSHILSSSILSRLVILEGRKLPAHILDGLHINFQRDSWDNKSVKLTAALLDHIVMNKDLFMIKSKSKLLPEPSDGAPVAALALMRAVFGSDTSNIMSSKHFCKLHADATLLDSICATPASELRGWVMETQRKSSVHLGSFKAPKELFFSSNSDATGEYIWDSSHFMSSSLLIGPLAFNAVIRNFKNEEKSSFVRSLFTKIRLKLSSSSSAPPPLTSTLKSILILPVSDSDSKVWLSGEGWKKLIVPSNVCSLRIRPVFTPSTANERKKKNYFKDQSNNKNEEEISGLQEETLRAENAILCHENTLKSIEFDDDHSQFAFLSLVNDCIVHSFLGFKDSASILCSQNANLYSSVESITLNKKQNSTLSNGLFKRYTTTYNFFSASLIYSIFLNSCHLPNSIFNPESISHSLLSQKNSNINQQVIDLFFYHITKIIWASIPSSLNIYLPIPLLKMLARNALVENYLSPSHLQTLCTCLVLLHNSELLPLNIQSKLMLHIPQASWVSNISSILSLTGLISSSAIESAGKALYILRLKVASLLGVSENYIFYNWSFSTLKIKNHEYDSNKFPDKIPDLYNNFIAMLSSHSNCLSTDNGVSTNYLSHRLQPKGVLNASSPNLLELQINALNSSSYSLKNNLCEILESTLPPPPPSMAEIITSADNLNVLHDASSSSRASWYSEAPFFANAVKKLASNNHSNLQSSFIGPALRSVDSANSLSCVSHLDSPSPLFSSHPPEVPQIFSLTTSYGVLFPPQMLSPMSPNSSSGIFLNGSSVEESRSQRNSHANEPQITMIEQISLPPLVHDLNRPSSLGGYFTDDLSLSPLTAATEQRHLRFDGGASGILSSPIMSSQEGANHHHHHFGSVSINHIANGQIVEDDGDNFILPHRVRGRRLPGRLTSGSVSLLASPVPNIQTTRATQLRSEFNHFKMSQYPSPNFFEEQRQNKKDFFGFNNMMRAPPPPRLNTDIPSMLTSNLRSLPRKSNNLEKMSSTNAVNFEFNNDNVTSGYDYLSSNSPRPLSSALLAGFEARSSFSNSQNLNSMFSASGSSLNNNNNYNNRHNNKNKNVNDATLTSQLRPTSHVARLIRHFNAGAVGDVFSPPKTTTKSDTVVGKNPSAGEGSGVLAIAPSSDVFLNKENKNNIKSRNNVTIHHHKRNQSSGISKFVPFSSNKKLSPSSTNRTSISLQHQKGHSVSLSRNNLPVHMPRKSPAHHQPFDQLSITTDPKAASPTHSQVHVTDGGVLNVQNSQQQQQHTSSISSSVKILSSKLAAPTHHNSKIKIRKEDNQEQSKSISSPHHPVLTTATPSFIIGDMVSNPMIMHRSSSSLASKFSSNLVPTSTHASILPRNLLYKGKMSNLQFQKQNNTDLQSNSHVFNVNNNKNKTISANKTLDIGISSFTSPHHQSFQSHSVAATLQKQLQIQNTKNENKISSESIAAPNSPLIIRRSARRLNTSTSGTSVCSSLFKLTSKPSLSMEQYIDEEDIQMALKIADRTPTGNQDLQGTMANEKNSYNNSHDSEHHRSVHLNVITSNSLKSTVTKSERSIKSSYASHRKFVPSLQADDIEPTVSSRISNTSPFNSPPLNSHIEANNEPLMAHHLIALPSMKLNKNIMDKKQLFDTDDAATSSRIHSSCNDLYTSITQKHLVSSNASVSKSPRSKTMLENLISAMQCELNIQTGEISSFLENEKLHDLETSDKNNFSEHTKNKTESISPKGVVITSEETNNTIQTFNPCDINHSGMISQHNNMLLFSSANPNVTTIPKTKISPPSQANILQYSHPSNNHSDNFNTSLSQDHLQDDDNDAQRRLRLELLSVDGDVVCQLDVLEVDIMFSAKRTPCTFEEMENGGWLQSRNTRLRITRERTKESANKLLFRRIQSKPNHRVMKTINKKLKGLRSWYKHLNIESLPPYFSEKEANAVNVLQKLRHFEANIRTQ